ncbi:MAG: SUMF1/EgtB/PvdO family nonheme iron enzyme [Caldilineaceae bacterium]|nr:SUMF1/EgtB/PvdO family nonheme iron enzyme [Caldilineaceae bacterium]
MKEIPRWAKWALTLAGMTALIGLGFTVRLWLPWLLPFLDNQGERWQSLASLVQVIMWGIGGGFLIWRIWFGREGETHARTTAHIDTGGGSSADDVTITNGNFVGRDAITHIYHTYQSGPGDAALSEEAFRRILLDYLGWVQRAYAQARLYGLESLRPTAGRPVRNLTQVFVPLSLRRFTPPARRQIEELARDFSGDPLAENRAYIALVAQQKEAGERVELAALLTTDPRLAIIGGAGSGKSTLLSYLAFCLADHAQNGSELPFTLPAERTAPVPLLIPLRYYRQYRDECQNARGRSLDHPRSGTLAGFVPWYLKRRSPALELSEDFFDRLLLGGGCLIMLDGLDEIVDSTERGQIRTKVEQLAQDIYPGNLFVVTAREAGYRENAVFGDDFVRLDVQPLTADEIHALVHNWCGLIYGAEAATQTDEIVRAIEEINQRYRQQNLPPLIDTPLMTTMVISVKWGETELPRERAKLYEAAVKVILQAQYLSEDESREALINWGGPWEEQQIWLSHLALAMHSRGRGSATQTAEGIRAILAEKLSPAQLDTFVAAVRLRGGVLEERGELFQFLHLTFQEFLAARLLAKERKASWPILRQYVGDAWWREVFLLHYGFAKTDYAPYAEAFLNWLSAIPGSDPATRLAGLELAAAAVLEIERLDPELRRRQAQRLADFLFTDHTHAHTDPQQRLAASRTLDRLGDPRPGVGLRPDGMPDIDWVKIPETDAQGRRDFIYQDGKRDREPTFWMARYPITYAQFQAFVAAEDGLRNGRWWQGLAQSDNDDLAEQAFKFWNHPRERVTWYQALAFCRWLSEQAMDDPSLLPPEAQNGNWRITLPTEWQWEKAARGHDGLIYPWGPEYISGYANVDETEAGVEPHKLGQTSAVGLYPQGKSPYGILDLSGNVWEWCLNEYNNPERFQEEGDEGRVLRGGSWYSSAASATASSRYGDLPRYWDSYDGFRVVVVPISHG